MGIEEGGLPWKAVALDVEMDLAEGNEKGPRWKAVCVLFVKGSKSLGEVGDGRKDRGLFLTTSVFNVEWNAVDIRIGLEYWGVHQRGGEAFWFSQGTNSTFTPHMALIHPCTLRYWMLMHN